MLNDNIEKKLSKINEILDKTECDIHFNLNQIERIKICIETDKEHLSTLRNVVTGKFIEIDEKLKKRGSNANRKRTTTKTA